jgi:MFS family permease
MVYSMFSLFLNKIMGASESSIGIILMFGSLIGILFSSKIGRMSDKIGRKTIMLLSIGGFGTASLLYSLIPDYRYVFPIRIVDAISSIGLLVSIPAYIADIAPAEERGYGMGIYQRFSYLGWMLGPLFGGTLFELIGYRTTFIIASGVVFISLIPFFIMIEEEKRISGEE